MLQVYIARKVHDGCGPTVFQGRFILGGFVCVCVPRTSWLSRWIGQFVHGMERVWQTRPEI